MADRRPISRPQSQNQETNMTEKSRNDDLARSTTARRALAELFLGKSPEEWRAEETQTVVLRKENRPAAGEGGQGAPLPRPRNFGENPAPSPPPPQDFPLPPTKT